MEAHQLLRGEKPLVTPLDAMEAESHRRAITRLQDTVKWLLTSTAAVATVLLAGVRFLDIRTASFRSQLLVLSLVFLALACTVGAIWSAGRVLVAKPVTLDEILQRAQEFPAGRIRKKMRRGERGTKYHPFKAIREGLRLVNVGGIRVDVATLEAWTDRRRKLAKVIDAGSVEPGTALKAEAMVSAIDEAMEIVDAIVEYQAVKGAYNHARLWLIGAIASGYLALASFAKAGG